MVFQKNVATDFDELAVAWQLIQNCGQGDYHPFTFPMTMQVACGDSWGNFTQQQPAQNGDLFTMANAGNHTGDVLSRQPGGSNSPNEVQVLNGLGQGAMNATIFKNGKPLAIKTTIAPQQKAVFQFKPTIWVGVVSQVVEGQVMNSAIMSNINTEISLMGIASADIVMRGGGAGTLSQPLTFSLENVVMA